jgi:hypothetical protein
LSSWCKVCLKAAYRANYSPAAAHRSYTKHREKILAHHRKRRLANPEHYRAIDHKTKKKRHAEAPEIKRAADRKRYAENREKIREYARSQAA